MTTREKMEAFYAEIARQQVADIEKHCRTVHADAVVRSFLMVFGGPLRSAQALLKKAVGSKPQQQPTLQ
jgi:hypothetical protein